MAENNNLSKEIKFRKYKKGDEIELVKLYNSCFPKRINLDYWKWKYEENPYGFEISIGINKERKIIGQYCSQFKVGWSLGKKSKIINVVDVCVDKHYRHKGFYHDAIKLQYTLPYLKIPSLTINFPKKEITQLAFKYGYADGVIEIPIYSKKLSKLKYFLRGKDYKAYRLSRINDVHSIKRELNLLWKKKKKELNISVVRDFKYLNWRIFDCPLNNHFFVIKNEGKIVGYFSVFKYNNISYVTDILILNDYLDGSIINMADKLCLNLKTKLVKIMILDEKLEDLLLKKGYKKEVNVSLLYFGTLKYANKFVPYITFSDSDILDFNF